MAVSRNPPEAIARQLRQEAGFGCAMCGNPFVQYHHIDPWEFEKHFDPDRMVAICPTCHSRFERMTRDKQLRIKKNPTNISRGVVRGFLEFKVPLSSIAIGSNKFNDCKNLIGFEDELLLGWSLINGEFSITAHIYGRSGKELLFIVDNEVIFIAGDFWDVRFKYNFLELRSKHGAHVVRFDFRRFPVALRFKSFVAGHAVSASSTEVIGKFGNASSICLTSCTFDRVTGFCLHFYGDEWRSNAIDPVHSAVGYQIIPEVEHVAMAKRTILY